MRRAGLLIALALLSCAPDESAARPDVSAAAEGLPEDAVFRVDGKEIITRSQVERWLECVRFVEPSASLPHQKRLSLTNFALPQAFARNIDRRAYEEARERAGNIHARLLDGGVPGVDTPTPETIDGTWKEVGLSLWWECRDMVPGEWSRPHETVGAFEIFRLREAPEEPWAPGRRVKVDLIRIPYVPTEAPRALIQQAMDEGKLEILDPEWAEIVPLIYHNEMESEIVSVRGDEPAEGERDE